MPVTSGVGTEREEGDVGEFTRFLGVSVWDFSGSVTTELTEGGEDGWMSLEVGSNDTIKESDLMELILWTLDVDSESTIGSGEPIYCVIFVCSESD